MGDDLTRSVLAIIIIVAFLGLVLIVVIGWVNIADPTVAKIVGTLVGYVTAMLNPIILRYFK